MMRSLRTMSAIKLNNRVDSYGQAQGLSPTRWTDDLKQRIHGGLKPLQTKVTGVPSVKLMPNSGRCTADMIVILNALSATEAYMCFTHRHNLIQYQKYIDS